MEKIIDSEMAFEEALAGKDIPQEIVNTLVLIDIDHISFDGLVHQGQLLVHKNVSGELQEIFKRLLVLKFPIEKIIPVVAYNWIDEASMADSNSSAFNYRTIYGTDRLSNHSYGLAVDINPKINPYYASDGKIFPEGSAYNPDAKGALVGGGSAVALFEKYGWEWGGKWNPPDWQHFQKIVK